MCGDVKSTSSTMPVTEVQWIGASCGRHSSYTFYRGFRLIVDGVAKNFCLGEFYFVRNSTDQPICIAELQLVWYDASTDSQLASARLYFRPEDTPAGRLANHGQDELLYADQKVVIKCHDMAVWQNSGLQWNSGMVPLCESDFVCADDKYYLNSNYAAKEKETLKHAKDVWVKGDHPHRLHILTFPAYCRYRALKKRLLSGMCLTKAQLVALGGVITEHKSMRVLFCRDSFHHPYLDKFELSGDNKAPVLKGRPRKKKKLTTAQNNVLKKKRFVADIQNHLGNSPAAKRCKLSEEEESTGSDMSEGVLDRIKAPPAVGRKTQSSGPPPLVKPRVQVSIAEKAKTAEIPKVTAQEVSLSRGENPKIPPPLIPSSRITSDVVCTSQPLQSSRKQINGNITECSRTTPIQKQVFSSSTKLRDVENNTNNNNTVLSIKPHVADRIQTNMTVTSPNPSLESKTGKILNSLVENKKPSSGTSVTYTHNLDSVRTIPAVKADVRSHTVISTRPVTTTQGTVSTQLAASTCATVRSHPVASLQQPVSSVQAAPPKSQVVTPISGSISSSVNVGDGMKTKPSKENEQRLLRPPYVSEEKKENAVKQTEESVIWKKKKKRLRMPGNVKDEVYDDDDEKFFMQTLREFMRKNNQPLGKLPALGFKKVNLWTMYTTVQKFGGYDAVTGKRLWRRVYDSLGASTTITSAATYTKRHYERLLLPYEKHIRNNLKRQMDEKNSPLTDSRAQKELLDKTKKKPGLTVYNSKASQPSPHADKAAVEKQNQATSGARTTQGRVAPVSSVQALPSRVNSTPDAKRNAISATDSEQMQPVMAPAVSRASFKQVISPVSVKSVSHESKPWGNKSNTAAVPPITSSADKRDRAMPTQQFPQEIPISQDRDHRCIKVIRSDEETSARTNTVYAKNTVAVDTNLKQAVPPQRVSRVVNDDTLLSPPLQQLNPANKGREIIDLTSDDSPPGSQSRSHTVPRTQKEKQEMSKVQRPIIGGGETEGRKHVQRSQIKQEYHHDSSKHHSTKEVQPNVEGMLAYDVRPYSGQPFNNNKVPPRVHESFSGLTIKKAADEVYPPLKQVTVLPKQEKKRLQQARVENLEGRYTHSPSSESVDEHFAEWLRRRSTVQHHPKSNVRHHIQSIIPELGQYGYVTEDNCPPDCSCSLSTSRKDEIRGPPPKPKKEHYEEELPFPGMTLYPGRWSPSSMVADHPDLYISSPPAHLQGPPDALASHLCTASRIFIPTPPMFSPPYHLGMAPIGAPTLITGTDDQLHIHPHCLLGSTYPGTSNSRTPDGTGYPLYSFT